MAQLESADYEQIASEQVTGKSVPLERKRNNGTVYKFYAMAQVGLVMIGDNTYRVSPETQILLKKVLKS